jgi:glutathione peroxidase
MTLTTTFASEISPDTEDGCAHWAEGGECDTNPTYMLQHCATSCAQVTQAHLEQQRNALANVSSFYDLTAQDIQGHVIDFSDFKGRVVIIVNVASYCGYTESHYRGLVELWSNLQQEPVELLAFPCNQFGGQEPESNEKIMEFAKSKGVTFRMMDKIQVNGPNASLVYQYLKHTAGPANIQWNFGTFYMLL